MLAFTASAQAVPTSHRILFSGGLCRSEQPPAPSVLGSLPGMSELRHSVLSANHLTKDPMDTGTYKVCKSPG